MSRGLDHRSILTETEVHAVTELTAAQEDVQEVEVDYDDLERGLLAGAYPTKRDFWAAVDSEVTRGRRRHVRASLMPEVREVFDALPDYPRIDIHAGMKLNEDSVRELRARHAQGESCRALANEFGVARSTLIELLAGRSWKWVA
jgi:hypothetical protein